MIKFLPITLISLLSSCSSLDYSYFSDFKNAFERNTIEVSDVYIENAPYSFIKVSYSRNEAIFVLSKISSSGIEEWIGSNYEVIKTKNGLIVETQGLDSDIKFYSTDFNNLMELAQFSSYVNLYNPDIIYEKIDFKSKDTDLVQSGESDLNSNIQVIKFQRKSSKIGWSSKDTYFYKNGVVVKSIQKINPLREPLTIDFYYKF
ncbi:YjbF family lipoprotein [Gammaproteobacteria bacterium]|jgi:hypothetical protein|nr:YjbF family lipoprotein [Gammaproteobacteria bacterium]